jgi:hypothetical protein
VLGAPGREAHHPSVLGFMMERGAIAVRLCARRIEFDRSTIGLERDGGCADLVRCDGVIQIGVPIGKQLEPATHRVERFTQTPAAPVRLARTFPRGNIPIGYGARRLRDL